MKISDSEITLGVSELIKILEREKNRRIALSDALVRLEKWCDSRLKTNAKHPIANKIVQIAIDRWEIEQVIDYEGYTSEGIPIGHTIWYIQATTDFERNKLHSLSKEQQAILKILYSSQTSDRLGTLTFQNAILKLEEIGFEVSEPPWIEGRTSHYFAPIDGVRTKWVCLIPEFEKLEEYQREIDWMIKHSMDADDRSSDIQ